jgi:hypothetical protein
MSKRKHFSYGLAVTKLALHSTLTANQKLVLIAIAEHLGSKDHAWPSYATLARLTSLTRRTVITTVKALADQGILTIRYPPGQRSNCYKPELKELMSRVSDEQVMTRIKGRLGEPARADDEGASLSTEQENKAMVKELHQYGETPSPIDEAVSPALVKRLHQNNETVSPERPIEATPRTPRVKRPLEHGLRLPPQSDGDGLSAGEGGMAHCYSGPDLGGDLFLSDSIDSGLDNRPFLSDFIKSHTLAAIVREAEVRLNNPVQDGNPFSFHNETPMSLLAARMTSLLIQIGFRPSFDDIVAAVNDEEFSGLKKLSWGLLLSDRFRHRFQYLIKKYHHQRINQHGSLTFLNGSTL